MSLEHGYTVRIKRSAEKEMDRLPVRVFDERQAFTVCAEREMGCVGHSPTPA